MNPIGCAGVEFIDESGGGAGVGLRKGGQHPKQGLAPAKTGHHWQIEYES